jgi:hypothetical protein
MLIPETDHARIRAVDLIEYDHSVKPPPEHEEHLLDRVTLAATSESFSANCDTRYKAVHNSGRRPLGAITLIVMHDTESTSALSAASWFANPDSRGSAHLVIDNDHCFRCLADDEIPWGAPGANYRGFHIEQAGFARWLGSFWKAFRSKELKRAAYKAALHAKRYGIKIRFLTAASMQDGVMNGITTHAECSHAFGGSHYDPGAGWPRAAFMTWVRGYFAVIKVMRIA